MMICRTWITLKDGTRLYARDRGLRAFCFEVNEEKPRLTKKVDPHVSEDPPGELMEI